MMTSSYVTAVDAVSEEELFGERVKLVDGLRGVDEVEDVFVPQHVEGAEVRVDQTTGSEFAQVLEEENYLIYF